MSPTKSFAGRLNPASRIAFCCAMLMMLLLLDVSFCGRSTIGDEPKQRSSETATSVAADVVIAAKRAERQANEAAILALRQKYELTAVDLPLDKLVEQVGKLTAIPVRIDTKTLIEAGIAADLPITFAARKPLPMTTVLQRVLQPHNLTWRLQNGVIVVTTREESQTHQEIQLHSVGRLLRLAEERERQIVAASPPVVGPVFFATTSGDALTNLVMTVTGQRWSETSGEGGLIKLVGQNFVVRQTQAGQAEVAALLRTIEAALARPLSSSPLRVFETDDEAAETARLERTLNREIEVTFSDTPLADVVAYFAEALDEDVFLDEQVLQDAGIANDLPITFSDGATARELLRRTLQPYGLGAIINGGGVRITTNDIEFQMPHTVVFDIAPLLQRGHDNTEIINLIEMTTAGPWQNTNGDSGMIMEFHGGLLVIRQSEQVLREVATSLHDLRLPKRNDANPANVQPAASMPARFYKADSKSEAEALERLIQEFVAPKTWDVNGGVGLLRVAEDRLIVRQTPSVHEELDKFLREYRQAKPIGTVSSKN